MKKLLLPFVLLLSLAVQGQFWTTAVGSIPSPATDCGPFDLLIDGNKPASNYNVTTATATVTGSTINVTLILTSSGFGLPTITPYTTTVPVPTTPAGTYTVVVDYTAAGNTELSTWTLVIDECATGPCSPDPTGLSSNIGATGNVSLSWTPVPTTVACRVRGRVLGTTSWATSAPVFGVEPSSFTVPSSVLISGSTYEWQVQCACSVSPLNATGWSASDNFVAPAPRIGQTTTEINLGPNPATEFIVLNGVDAGTQFEIYDMSGRKVISGSYLQQIDVSGLNAGLHMLLLENGERVSFMRAE